ncbi:fungal-specific transcription factor domain-containing protein [Dactylonectria macrodidyma]|uniref:Fungal-specific transcription factor domain-containing protein n=1 Tax=Dactylonectria macrodidyma TaxID=307937 RepID=A0A9P9EPD6_9HYPO|nr:fungal-specific transcription factor domain-containing protein [Dactylonectria macrodidyma]
MHDNNVSSPQGLSGQDDAAQAHLQQGNVPSRNRRKISLACEECRARKVRCDGARPQCSACRRRPRSGRPCMYLCEPSRVSGNKRVMQSLHDRLAYLEAKVTRETEPDMSSGNATFSSEGLEDERLSMQPSHAFNADPSPPQSLQRDTDSTVLVPKPRLPYPNVMTPARSSSEEIARESDGISRTSGQDLGTINAMGIAHLTTDAVTDTSSEFYGEPSAASLLCDIQDHCRQPSRPRADSQEQLTRSSRQSRRSIPNPYPLNEDDYHLPPRYVADGLLDLYRKRVQSTYPFLHWPTFVEAYNRLWLSDSDVKSLPQLTGAGLGGPNCPVPVFYSALNAAFALAAQFIDGTAQERKDRSTPFVRRSRHLMRLDFLDNADLSMVQALLILARYLQNSSLPTRCWNVVGIAYRMAQGLGLHLEMDKGTTSRLEREMRRRVWHSCTCLDTVLGMLTGRPCSNSTMSKVALPSTPDEEISASVSVQREHNDTDVCTTNFFAEAIKLSHILNRILGQIYDPWKENEASNWTKVADEKYYAQQVSSTIGLDHELDLFEAELPGALQSSTETPTIHCGGILSYQRHVLRTRLLHIRVLLYRPLLVQLCRKMNAQAKTGSGEKPQDVSRAQNQLHCAFAEKCSAACVETAQILIDHVNNGSETTYSGIPWYSCYYIYHAAMVVILADLCSTGMQRLSHRSLSKSWQTCQDFFRRMAEHDSESYRYFRRLESISRFIESASFNRTADDSMEASAPTCEERQELIMDHITNSFLDPTMGLGLEETQLDMPTQPNDIESVLCDNQLWTFAGLSAMNVDNMVI